MRRDTKPYFVWGVNGWVEVNYAIHDGTLPLRYGRWVHPDPQHWHYIRKQAMKRDRYRCCACNSKKNLNVHHRHYDNWGHELLEDVYTYCRDCHVWLHEQERRAA